MPTAQHRKFDGGMNQDTATFLIGEGECYRSYNMLYDRIGIARKRGGIPGVGATTTYVGDNLGLLVKDDGTEQLYARGGGGSPGISIVDQTTGVFSGALGVGSPIADGGRPFQHYGFLVYPNIGDAIGTNGIFSTAFGLAGASPSSSYTFATPASVAFTAGDKRITCAAGDNPPVNMAVGQIIHIQYGTAFQSWYVGRVTRLVSSTAFEVFPTPSVSSTAPIAVVSRGFTAPSQGVGVGQQEPAYVGSKFGMSFQGRIVLANLSIFDAGHFQRAELNPRGVAFSTVLLEQPLSPTVSAPPNQYSGATWHMNAGYPPLNQFNIPAQEAITSMSPTGFGDAVIFSAFRAFRLTGNLSTQYGTTQSITWAVREIPNSVGCMSERSLQRTPRGIVFAHDSGIYTTDGNSMHPLMYKKMSDYWKGLQGTLFKIYGSALIRGNHYYICGLRGDGTFWGLVCNLDSLAWGSLTGKLTAPSSWIINSAVQDYADTSRVWGLKWWDQSGGAPSMTGGQLLKLDQMFVPSASNRADSDGQQVSWDYDSRSFTEDTPTIQKVWRQVTIEYKNVGGAGAKVQPVLNMDGAEGILAGGPLLALPQQDVYSVTAASNATPIVLTTSITHGITADCWVHVTGVSGNTAANGPFRVQAVTSNTITLMGSSGNGAYTSGGTVQAMDSRDFALDGTILGQGSDSNNAAILYRFFDSGSAGADVFELWGITHSWEQRDPHNE